MSFFLSLLKKLQLAKHDGRPLWRYMLKDEDFEKLLNELKYSNPISIDPRDVTIYYAEWWKRNYNGGVPSKEAVFNSLKGNVRFNFNLNDFYKLARQGAQMLGVKWITKQNTLYFKTLLLQGGLPLLHISENHGKYQNFLLAVLEEQPDTIEDFIFNPYIIGLLPKSSQNDIIYENCFEIIKSILNDEDFYEELLNSNEVLTKISKKLKVRKQSLQRRQRLSKPKNYWLLSFKKEKINISLRIGFADKYNTESLSNILGFEVTGKDYQFYLNDELICVFRKMINGNFKTDWFQHNDQKWREESKLPYAYVIEEGKKIAVNDFIQTIPNLHEPSLWTNYSDNEWRLIKGNGTSYKEAAILYPNEWYCNQLPKIISIYGKDLSWLIFKGEVELNHQEENRKYLSEVNSFDWTIVSQKPNWMLRTSIPVVQLKPNVIVYDENNKKLPVSKFKIWMKKHNSNAIWEELAMLNYIPLGCIDLKIEKDGLVAYDMFFNIGRLQANYTEKSIDKAKIAFINIDYFELKLAESDILAIENEGNSFSLKVKTEFLKIPKGINASIGQRNQKKLYFEMATPFEGMIITDKDGRIISENEQLSLANLYGLRILSTPNTGTILTIKNRLKPDVKIIKEIKESSQPIISFKEDIEKLYYLADVMDHNNKVCFELKDGNQSKTFEVSGFSHTLNIDEQNASKVCLNNNDELDLYAIPLNCSSNNIELIPLFKDASGYTITNTEITYQFIIISSSDQGNQLMPRFINTDKNFNSKDKDQRIEDYHNQLLEASFDNEIWKQLLSYFNICIKNNLPFSTFDQLRAISRSSKVASRAFFYLGINQNDRDLYIQKVIPKMEQDLGFCFHWLSKSDWISASDEINQMYDWKYLKETGSLVSNYMREFGLLEVFNFINDSHIQKKPILNSDIIELRSQLGERVLNELPYKIPKITKSYNIPIKEHLPVRLLLQSPIAVAESINHNQKEYPIWAGDDFRDTIRRNIQYSQYLNQEFYNRIISHVLSHN